jgi:hypothetical protein
LLEQLSEMRQRLVELLERLKKSSQPLEEAVATLPVSRNDRLGFRAPLEQAMPLLFGSKLPLSGLRERLLESKSRREASLDRRSSFFAPLDESLRRRSESRARRLSLESSLS